jgi:hypothetical protein
LLVKQCSDGPWLTASNSNVTYTANKLAEAPKRHFSGPSEYAGENSERNVMRCSRCGRALRDESAVYDTVGEADGPAGLIGQATALYPVTICPECSRKRMKTFWILIGLVLGVVLAIVAIDYGIHWLR